MASIKVAIHQPDFMPWGGFFDKIAKADIWVVLDHVANRPNDGTWIKRVKMIISGYPRWITIPIKKPKGREFMPINEMEINIIDKRHIRKMFKSIRRSYCKTDYYEEFIDLVDEYEGSTSTSLCDRNISFITSVFERIGIKKSLIYSSELKCKKKSTHLLIEICKMLNANEYICGMGAGGYQEDSLFNKEGIQIVYSNYSDTPYTQEGCLKSYLPGMSILDRLMNCGLTGYLR